MRPFHASCIQEGVDLLVFLLLYIVLLRFVPYFLALNWLKAYKVAVEAVIALVDDGRDPKGVGVDEMLRLLESR